MKLKAAFIFLTLLFSLLSPAQEITIEVKNTLDFSRQEVVAIKRDQLSKTLKSNKEVDARIKKAGISGYLPTQWIDNDGDGNNDELLFVAEVDANAATNYILVFDKNIPSPMQENAAYSRFVPERSDDYAWENDKVAFRAYGPKGQEEALRGVSGSTLSSGIDIWLKRVPYPVINKWYAGHVASPGYYHTDRGEGYDPYHVGASRGTGGSGIWVNDSLQVSKNFISYRIIADGPLRTVFELDYAPWSEFGVHETKRISLDTGSYFSKFEVSLSSDKKLPDYAIGITLDKNEGSVKINKEKGWFRHSEKIDGAFVGEGIVTDPKTIQSAFANVSGSADQSNLLILLKPAGKIVYYSGFGWEKYDVEKVSDWDAILERQAEIIVHPLEVRIGK